LSASFFGALNALGISVLGEYVVRIYDQVRARPIYLVGRAVGRRKLSPRLSPNKTWEGYLAGVAAGALAGAGLAAIWWIGAGPVSSLSPGLGAAVGGILGAITPLGDLGISMLKRQMRVKDTGALLTGHGGALDRMDSWLWAGALAYYLVGWLS